MSHPAGPDDRASLTPDALRAALDAGEALILLDVREPHEFAAGRIDGAVNVPLAELTAVAPRVVPDPGARVVVYCERGPRAQRARATLRDQGYTDVGVMLPGYAAWPAASSATGLTVAQRARYARHLSLPEVGVAGQRALLDARVLLVGAGGLGSPVALYLAAAGVGTLGIVDDDRVDLSNLQRQVIHTTDRVGSLKVESAATALRALNPEVRVHAHATRLGPDNVDGLLADYDLVVDGTDNFATRYLLNDRAVRAGKTVVHGSIYRFEGQVSTFAPGEGPCYRCVYPAAPPPSLAPPCGEAGVLGVLPGVIGAMQATEVLKRVMRVGECLVGRLLTWDALTMQSRTLRVRRDPACPACGDRAVRASCESTGD
jgi:molybdopterin/thiamine biosynthesis adenylyltransferase/rhodanese-related sulfurtransferase